MSKLETSYQAASQVFTILEHADGVGAESGRRDDGDVKAGNEGAAMRVDPTVTS